jgi:hypothetical protein
VGEGYHRRMNAVLRTYMLAVVEDGAVRRRLEPALGGDLGEGGAEEEGEK